MTDEEHPSHSSVAIDSAWDPESGRARLQANEGKFRVVGVDTFEGTDWVYNEYDTPEEAQTCADAHGGEMLKTHVYDDQGRHLHQAGTY